MKIGENWWKLVRLLSPTIPQHIYIFGNDSSNQLRFHEHFLKILWKLVLATKPQHIHIFLIILSSLSSCSENFQKIFWKSVKIYENGWNWNQDLTATYRYFWNSLDVPINNTQQNWWMRSKNWWKYVNILSPTIPQHIYSFGIVCTSA